MMSIVRALMFLTCPLSSESGTTWEGACHPGTETVPFESLRIVSQPMKFRQSDADKWERLNQPLENK